MSTPRSRAVLSEPPSGTHKMILSAPNRALHPLRGRAEHRAQFESATAHRAAPRDTCVVYRCHVVNSLPLRAFAFAVRRSMSSR